MSSKIWEVSKEYLQSIFDESNSLKDVLQKLGYKSFSGNSVTLKKRIKSDGICLDGMEKNKKHMRQKIMKSISSDPYGYDDYLTENCNHTRKVVREYIIKNNIVSYSCEKCGNRGEWLGEKMVLQLEHKNGISNDNRVNNLCFLCPNCHSQTATWGGKKNKKAKKDKIKKERPKKFVVGKEELEKLILDIPFTKIGEMFGVSDNAIRKRCKKMGISLPNFKASHWTEK